MASVADYLHKKANVLRTSGPNIFIECPGCDTRKAKCAIHIHKALGNCFRAKCPLHGGFSFPTLITYLEKVSYSEALSIAARYSDEVEKEFKAKTFGTNRNYPINSLPLQELINYADHKNEKLLYFLAVHGTNYLVQKRQLTLEQIEQYQLGVGWEDYRISDAVIAARYGMVIVPIFFNQEIVSYTARSIEVSGAMLGRQKHYHPVAVEDYLTQGQILFNCDIAFPHAKEVGYIVIVEDVWSAIKLNAVATFGSNLSEDQIYILVNNWKGPVVICRDNDEAGKDAAFQDAVKLSRYYSDIRIVNPVGIDPDDDLDGTRRQIELSKPVDMFRLHLSRRLIPVV